MGEVEESARKMDANLKRKVARREDMYSAGSAQAT
jgi:hypothetical protein